MSRKLLNLDATLAQRASFTVSNDSALNGNLPQGYLIDEILSDPLAAKDSENDSFCFLSHASCMVVRVECY